MNLETPLRDGHFMAAYQEERRRRLAKLPHGQQALILAEPYSAQAREFGEQIVRDLEFGEMPLKAALQLLVEASYFAHDNQDLAQARNKVRRWMDRQ